jgi:hypothetical protein
MAVAPPDGAAVICPAKTTAQPLLTAGAVAETAPDADTPPDRTVAEPEIGGKGAEVITPLVTLNEKALLRFPPSD